MEKVYVVDSLPSFLLRKRCPQRRCLTIFVAVAKFDRRRSRLRGGSEKVRPFETAFPLARRGRKEGRRRAPSADASFPFPRLKEIARNKGLISADRNNRATLLLTIPRSTFKSSTKDLYPTIFEVLFGALAARGLWSFPAPRSAGFYDPGTRVLSLLRRLNTVGRYRRYLEWILA